MFHRNGVRHPSGQCQKSIGHVAQSAICFIRRLQRNLRISTQKLGYAHAGRAGYLYECAQPSRCDSTDNRIATDERVAEPPSFMPTTVLMQRDNGISILLKDLPDQV